MNNKNITIAKRIATYVAQVGGRAYYVGGCVRDQILGNNNKDIDIEVHGISPEQLEKILANIGEMLYMGKAFGIYRLRHYDFDISLPRAENSSENQKADVDPYIGLRKAAQRRDFTINTMMQDVLTNEIIDFFGGKEDLKRRVITQVSESTFSTDPLRVFRAAQFAARFNFEIDIKTQEAASVADVTQVAGERIMGELEKALMKSEKPSVFFEAIRKMGQLSVWFPELEALIDVPQNPSHHPEGDVWVHTMQVLDITAKLKEKATYPLWLMLSSICHDYGKPLVTEEKNGVIHAYEHEGKGIQPTESFLCRITKDIKLTRYVLNMVELHMKPNAMVANNSREKSFMKLFDRSVCPEDLLLLAKADHLGRCSESSSVIALLNNYEYTEQILSKMLTLYHDRMAQPYVMGHDLLQVGVESGPLMGEALQYAHKLRLNGVSKDDQLKHTLGWLRNKKNK